MKRENHRPDQAESSVYYLKAVDAENLYVPGPRTQPVSARVVLELIPCSEDVQEEPSATWDPDSFDDTDLDLTADRERKILASRVTAHDAAVPSEQPEHNDSWDESSTTDEDGIPLGSPSEEELAAEPEPVIEDLDSRWLDLLSAMPDSGSGSDSVNDLDMEDIDEDLLDPEPDVRRSEFGDKIKASGTLSRWERARQEALQLVDTTGWDPNGVDILTEIFDRYWWSTAKEAVRRQIEQGLNVCDLEIALEARVAWENHPEFADSQLRYTYEQMSWPAAIELGRAFRSIPSSEEIELLLMEAFDQWRRRAYRSFSSFHEFVRWLSRSADPGMVSSPVACTEVMPRARDRYSEESWIKEVLRTNARLDDDDDS